MEMAISLDTSIFKEAEREAKQLHVSVPELCSLAIKEFVRKRNKTDITRQINEFLLTNKVELDDDIIQTQYEMLGEEDW